MFLFLSLVILFYRCSFFIFTHWFAIFIIFLFLLLIFEFWFFIFICFQPRFEPLKQHCWWTCIPPFIHPKFHGSKCFYHLRDVPPKSSALLGRCPGFGGAVSEGCSRGLIKYECHPVIACGAQALIHHPPAMPGWVNQTCPVTPPMSAQTSLKSYHTNLLTADESLGCGSPTQGLHSWPLCHLWFTIEHNTQHSRKLWSFSATVMKICCVPISDLFSPASWK